jgi:Protein of unknown function (DUF1501)
MLTVFDSYRPGVYSRREYLRIGSSAIGGLGLSSLLAAAADASLNDVLRDRSVIVLNLQGGPTQFETFDPKMTAPREVRSITGEVATAVPGVTFGSGFPRLAALADKMAVVRSYRHGISSHGPAAMHVMAGGNPTGAMMGALFSRVAGLTNPSTGMPNNSLITSRAMGADFKELYYNADRVSQTGSLPGAYKPFDLSAGGEIIDNMKLHVEGERLGDRRELLAQIDRLRRNADKHGSFELANRFERQAFDVLVRGVAGAFDLSKEDPRTVERYDTSELAPTAAVQQRNSYAKQFSPVALGKQMLLARRLCEAGCGFVTVTCPGWDMHGGGKEFTMADGLATLSPAVDRAVSAFIEDTESRGLTKKILLVITGEFGRTPRINKNGGRDHWGNLCTLAFVGGGLQMGQAVGRSNQTGSEPSSDPISSNDVLATIMHCLFDVGQVRLLQGVPQDVERVITSGTPIRELI